MMVGAAGKEDEAAGRSFGGVGTPSAQGVGYPCLYYNNSCRRQSIRIALLKLKNKIEREFHFKAQV